MRRRPVQFALALVLIVGVIIGGYFAFRRTLIADIREASLNIDTTDPVAHGATLFQTRGCAGCHQLDSAGAAGDEGPNLTGIGGRETLAYLVESIREPGAVIADNCPEGVCQPIMPAYGTFLTTEQIDALAAYLASQQ
ncbi:MAG: cytochrome c [bacterium]|nr:cytochrome c [bacterium]